MMDAAFKRQQLVALKAMIGNGQLIPPKRKGFSPKVRKAVRAQQDGYCGRCDELLGRRFEIDHILERDLGGSDELSNLVALHPECHRPKTSARAPVLAKVHRLHNDTFGEPKEPKGRKLQGRPFDKTKTKGFDGQVRPR